MVIMCIYRANCLNTLILADNVQSLVSVKTIGEAGNRRMLGKVVFSKASVCESSRFVCFKTMFAVTLPHSLRALARGFSLGGGGQIM